MLTQLDEQDKQLPQDHHASKTGRQARGSIVREQTRDVQSFLPETRESARREAEPRERREAERRDGAERAPRAEREGESFVTFFQGDA